jgi:outer membrane protein
MEGIIRAGAVLALPLAALFAWAAPLAGTPVEGMVQDAAPGDSLPATRPLTLEEALLRALDVAPRIRQWDASREAAEATAGWLASPYLPTVTAGASLTRSRFPTIVTPIREPGTFPPLADEIGEASVSLSWTLFDFGKGREGRQAARVLAEASGARTEHARMETLEKVTEHFVQLAVLEELRGAQQTRLAGFEENESQVRALVEEGRLPAVDLLRIAEVLLEAEADLRSTEEENHRIVASLSAELALEEPLDPEEVRAPELRGDLPPPLLPTSPNPRGPLVDAAEARLRAADHESREARRAVLPELQILGQQRLRSAPDVATDRDWLVGVQIRIPIFQGSALSGIQARDARVRERSAELDGARASVEVALGDLHALERDARHRIGVLDARIGHLEEAHRIELASHREGRATLTEVLSTEARLAGARAERIGLMGTVVLAHVRTAALTGALSVSTPRRLLGDER